MLLNEWFGSKWSVIEFTWAKFIRKTTQKPFTEVKKSQNEV